MEGPLKNPRHERFAVLVANGKTQADAYREVYPRSRAWKDEAVHVKGSELAGRVSVRVRELQEVLAERSAIDKTEVVNALAKVVRNAELDKVPLIGAVSELAKLMGWYAPVKQQVEQEFNWKPDEAVMQRIGEALARAEAGKK